MEGQRTSLKEEEEESSSFREAGKKVELRAREELRRPSVRETKKPEGCSAARAQGGPGWVRLSG